MNENKKREKRIGEEIVAITQICAEQGLICSSDGNISVRLNDERFLVTPSGLYKRLIEVEHLLIVNQEGELIKGKPGLLPSSEMLMHLEAYKQRKDIHAVLHAHPPYATALTIAGIPFPTDIIPEVLIALGEVPTAPYATPGTQELALTVREPIKTHNAVLLSHHGSLTIGKTLQEALIALERMEYTAHLYYLASNLGKVIPLPKDEVDRLRDIIRKDSP